MELASRESSMVKLPKWPLATTSALVEVVLKHVLHLPDLIDMVAMMLLDVYKVSNSEVRFK